MPVKDNFMVCSTLGDMSHLTIQKILTAKSTTIQFISSKRSFRSTYECENQKKNSELSRGGLKFISDLLQKILTIAERCSSGKTL